MKLADAPKYAVVDGVVYHLVRDFAAISWFYMRYAVPPDVMLGKTKSRWPRRIEVGKLPDHGVVDAETATRMNRASVDAYVARLAAKRGQR